jgi:hypothetical protein
MYNRKDFLDKKISFRTYYAQFVTEEIKDSVRSTFGKEKLTQAIAIDEHLNNIPLREWDHVGFYFKYSVILRKKLKDAGDWFSDAGMVCILKEAARQIIEGE